MPTVNDLPTRNELISRPVTLDGVRPVVRNYVDGVLMTREEFIDSLDIDMMAAEFRLQNYHPDIPDRSWGALAPGARNTWTAHAQRVLNAALGKDTE